MVTVSNTANSAALKAAIIAHFPTLEHCRSWSVLRCERTGLRPTILKKCQDNAHNIKAIKAVHADQHDQGQGKGTLLYLKPDNGNQA